jgi:hypothetical protein
VRMRLTRAVLLLALAAAAIATPASGAPGAAQAADALAKQETAARAKAGDEMAGLARLSASLSAYDDARRAWSKALAFAPENKLFRSELDKLKGRKSAPSKGALTQIADRRQKGLVKCADLLGPVVSAYLKAERTDDLARVVALMRAQELPAEATLGKLGVVFFEPYLDWRSQKDVARLDAGDEYVDGAWVPAARVAEMNAEHADWSNPWVISDEVHEVRTTQPLRTARRVMAHVAAYRRFFVGYFTGEWDLTPPDVKLPVIVTGTRAEMDERAEPFGGSTPPGAAAFYLSTNSVGNPCFVSFEMQAANGPRMKVGFEGLQWVFEHELGHQIAFEFSKHAADLTRLSHDDAWAIEGVAQFLPHYDLVDGAWVMKKPKTIAMGAGYIEGDLAWCRAHADSLPPLAQFFAQSYEQFMTPQNYHIAATLAWYLLEGKDRAYRPAFVKLLETVHQSRGDASTFASCFEGVDIATLDAEFRAFCRGIQLDR